MTKYIISIVMLSLSLNVQAQADLTGTVTRNLIIDSDEERVFSNFDSIVIDSDKIHDITLKDGTVISIEELNQKMREGHFKDQR